MTRLDMHAFIARSTGVVTLLVALALAACGDEATGEPGGAGASSADGGGGAGAGAGAMGGSGGAGASGASGGSGGSGGTGGGAGGEEPAPPPAVANELTSANGKMAGGGFELTFQLGRPAHQPEAANATHALECAAPVQ